MSAPSRVLVACVGNIFLGDDGFGTHVAAALARRSSEGAMPAGVRVEDYGIRSVHLVYELMNGYDVLVLVDTVGRQTGPPGTLYVIEPELSDLGSSEERQSAVEAHSMKPLNVIRLATSMGGPLKSVLLVGCEPGTLGPEEGQMGLSEPVEAVVDEAVKLVESLIAKILNEESDAKNGDTQ